MAETESVPLAAQLVVEGPVASMPVAGLLLICGAAIAEYQNDDMRTAILALYRSATQPAMAQAGRGLESAASRPGLSLLATEDPYVGVTDTRRRAADRAGARTEVLDGLGPSWMVEAPDRGAAVLTAFWESIE